MNRILFILHYPPPVHGSSIVGGFIKESRLINESFDCHYINLGTSATVEEIGRNPANKSFRYLRLIWQVKKTLLFFKPDLCYLTLSSAGIGFYKDALIVLIVRLFGIKRVYHFHNKGVRINQEKVIDNLLYRLVFENAEVILLSKYLYPDVQKYVPESRVHYCPNGIPDEAGVSRNPQVKNHNGKHSLSPLCASHLLFLSHLIESKGVFVLVKALKIIKEKGCTFHCIMIGGAGDVTEDQMRETIEESGLKGHVDVVGKKYGEEKRTAFEKADIFVHPTFNDCLPLVLIEAMQHSLPIVSTPEGAIPDIVEDGITGFLVPQKDAIAMADKLEVLIKDPDLRKKMGSAGRAKYEAQFTLERFERRMVEILTQVAEKKTSCVRLVRD